LDDVFEKSKLIACFFSINDIEQSYFYKSNINEMEHLATIGVFFAGLGIFLGSLGIFWFVDVYKKINTPKDEK